MKSKQELIEEWESAIEAAEFYGKGKEERLISYMKDFVSDLKQLDKPETLSQQWIDKNKKYAGVHDIGYYIPVDKLYGKIVPKQEEVEEGRVRLVVGFDGGTESYYATDIGDALNFLTDYDGRFTVSKEPMIPKFVADWIEENKKKNRSLVFAIKHIYDENEIGKSPKFFIWMETDDNEEVFARAWLDGYTVEEEQKYYVLDSEDIPLLERANDQTYKTTTGLSIYEDGRDNSRFELTEQEIKDYDPRYMAFAKPVEELGEEHDLHYTSHQ